MGVHVFGFVQAARTPGDVVVLKWLTVERLSLLSRARQFPKWLVPLSANEEHSIGSARPRSFPLRGFFWGRAPPIECSSFSETCRPNRDRFGPLSANEEHSIGGARPQKNPRSGKDLGRAPPIEFVELSRTESYGY